MEKITDIFNKLEHKVDNVLLKQTKVIEIELTKKENSGIITEEEEGELYGIRTFPNDLRGQQLRKKEHLNILSIKEKEELRRLYQLKDRQYRMSPELQKLWERTEANDLNIVEVSMGYGKSVESDGKQEKVIWTHSLGGCIGLLVFSEDENGHRIAILTHFSPLELSINMTELVRLIRSNSSMKTSKYKQFILFLEKEYKQNLQTQQWETVIRNQQSMDIVIKMIQLELGQDVEVKIEMYSSMYDDMTKDQGTVIVRIPPKGQSTYRTWFSRGQLGKSYKQ